jgi:hypothetical protein
LADAVGGVYDQVSCLKSKARLTAPAHIRLRSICRRMRVIRIIRLRLAVKIHVAINSMVFLSWLIAISRSDQ